MNIFFCIFTLKKTMLTFLSITGILLSIILISFNIKKNPSTIYLGFFFLLISTYTFIQYVMMYSESPELIGVFFLNVGFVTYLTGPMLYLVNTKYPYRRLSFEKK